MYNLLDPQTLAEPHELLHRMRTEDPVHWSPALHAWVLTSFATVNAAFRDPRLSNQRTETMVQLQLQGRDATLAKDFERVVRQMMLMKDGVAHRRLRLIGNHGFTPSVLDRTRDAIQRAVDRLLDRVEKRGTGRMDIVADLAQPMPSAVIAALFAIPETDHDLFQETSNAIAKFFGGTLGDPEVDARAANAAIITMENNFHALLEQRAAAPGDDLMSIFLAGQHEGKITAEEMCAQCIMLLVGGHVTTICQIANAVHALLAHPAELARLRADPALLAGAIEEIFRYDPALPFIYRLAAEDIELGGKKIERGQFVFMGVAAANRDPAVFPEPDRFDITRVGGHHIAFGAGPHVCIGSGLARRELEISLSTLLRRMPALRLDDTTAPQRQCDSLVFRGFRTLPVVF